MRESLSKLVVAVEHAMDDRVLSADSHIVEPADYWRRHIDRKYLERAPRAYEDENGVVMFVVDKNIKVGSVGAPSQAGVRFDDPSKVTFAGKWEEVRPGCADPNPRMKDLELDGIAGEVIYPTLGARLYGVIGGDLLSACCRAGNDWLIERFYSDELKNVFKPVAQLNVDEVDDAVAELERCAKQGLSGAMIPTYPGEGREYFKDSYNRLWATAQEMNIPLSFHISSARSGPGQLTVFAGDWEKPDAAAFMTTEDYWVRRSVANLIFSGVFERFPNLKFVIVEHELSWAFYFLDKMDNIYREYSQTAPHRFKSGKLPSDFFRTNIYITFQEDLRGVKGLPERIGTDTLMFGSDYPHAESTWPNSQEFLQNMLGDFPEPERRKLVCDNVARLYGFH
jgi:predicted TIM-barrel fold metal-dependent hydrolase